MIFRLCGTPSEEYWENLELHKKFKLPKYNRSLENAYRKFPESSLGLLRTLLALDPAHRVSASSALQDEVSTNWICAKLFYKKNKRKKKTALGPFQISF